MSTTATTTASTGGDSNVQVVGGPGGAAGEQVAAAKPNTLASILETAINSAKSRVSVAADLTAVRNQLATVTTERDTARTERDQARTERDTAKAEAAAATTQLSAICALFGVTSEELAGKDGKAASEIFAKKVSDATVEQVAGLGFSMAELPKQTSDSGVDPKLTGLARVEAAFKAQAAESN